MSIIIIRVSILFLHIVSIWAHQEAYYSYLGKLLPMLRLENSCICHACLSLLRGTLGGALGEALCGTFSRALDTFWACRSRRGGRHIEQTQVFFEFRKRQVRAEKRSRKEERGIGNPRSDEIINGSSLGARLPVRLIRRANERHI